VSGLRDCGNVGIAQPSADPGPAHDAAARGRGHWRHSVQRHSRPAFNACYDLDFGQIAAAAAERGCRLEINAAPDRMDLDDVHVHAAKKAKALIAISTDAHPPTFLEWMRFGVDQARRGWLERGDVVNSTSAFEAEEIPSPLSARARFGSKLVRSRFGASFLEIGNGPVLDPVCLRTRPSRGLVPCARRRRGAPPERGRASIVCAARR